MNIEKLCIEKDTEKSKILDYILNKYFQFENKVENRITMLIDRRDLNYLLECGFIMDEILQAIIERGYVLHGSPLDINELEPRTATGLGAAYERLTAVYCTNFAPIALFNAIMPKRSTKEKSHTGWYIQGSDFKNVDVIKFKANENMLDKFGNGFIYALSRKDVKSTPSKCKFVSEVSCLPIAKISIKRGETPGGKPPRGCRCILLQKHLRGGFTQYGLCTGEPFQERRRPFLPYPAKAYR